MSEFGSDDLRSETSHVILAHVEASHGGAAAQVLRMGPLLPLALVVAWAVAARGARAVEIIAGRGAAIAFAAAGAVHLGLIREHWTESTAAGLFFLASTLVEFALAGALWRGPSRRLALAVAGVAAVLVVVYVAARVTALPLTGGKEAVDGIGLVTKALEVVAGGLALVAGYWGQRRVSLPAGLVTGLPVLALAAAARPVLGEGPHPLQLVATVAGALPSSMVASDAGGGLGASATDGALVALLLRASGTGSFLVAGLAAAALRVALRRWVPACPVPLALLAVLLLSSATRLQVLHAGHPGEAVTSLVVFLLAGAIAAGAWRRGALGPAVAFVLGHLAGQGLRMATGRTSFEAVEIPAASLALFLVAVNAMGDPELPLGGSVALVAAAVAGVLDVALRQLGVPYSVLLAPAVVVAAAGVGSLLGHDAGRVTARPSRPRRGE